MAEPQLSRDAVLTTLGNVAFALRAQGWRASADDLDAVAEWLYQACVVEGGHCWERHTVPVSPSHECATCGQRREPAEDGR